MQALLSQCGLRFHRHVEAGCILGSKFRRDEVLDLAHHAAPVRVLVERRDHVAQAIARPEIVRILEGDERQRDGIDAILGGAGEAAAT